MRVVAIIPARYDSSRFPGKPLANKTGKTLIEHVYERVCQASLVDRVIIATDDDRIGKACDGFGGDWRMTRCDHASGTDRIAEVASDLDVDIVVNVQGDEPEIDPENIDIAVELLRDDSDTGIGTLAAVFDNDRDVSDPNVVKVVVDCLGRALYFSRSAIPFWRDRVAQSPVYRKHIGLYSYRKDVLLRLSEFPPTALEQAEKLEQLRALENGIAITVADVEHWAVGIDTPEQYERFVARYIKKVRG